MPKNKKPTTYQKMRAIVRKWDELMHFVHYDHHLINTIDLNSHSQLRMFKNVDGHTVLEILER